MRTRSMEKDGWSGKKTPKLYVDYDSTISECSTVELQLNAISECIKRNAGHGKYKLHQERVDDIVAGSSADHPQFMDRCLLFPTQDRFEWSLVDTILNEMGGFEHKWNRIVEEASILQGIKEQDFLKYAEQTPLRMNCIQVLERCIKARFPISVLSVNWSTNWIHHSLASRSELINSVISNDQDSVFRIFANELEYSSEDSLSTGNVVGTLQTAEDKGQMMETFLKEQGNEHHSIYIGDSILDLKPLLLADLGIVIGDNQDLRSILEHCNINLTPLNPTQFNKHLSTDHQIPKNSQFLVNHTKPPQGLLLDDQPTLYSVNTWTEIEQLLFEDHQGTNPVPRVMVIAGSDSGGGAGIQADIKTCMATGSFATTVITAITSQNTHGVQSVHPVPLDHIQNQIKSILTDLGTDVVKTGMLPSPEVVEEIGQSLKESEIKTLVVDPVLVSTSGHSLASNKVAEAMIQHLLPICSVLCPNIPEAEALLNQSITSLQEMKKAAKQLQSMGPEMVLIKGGHLITPGASSVIDVVFDGLATTEIEHPLIQTDRVHGTGCTLASAIASYLAQDYNPVQAVRSGIQYLNEALENSVSMQLGSGLQLPFNHGYFLHRWPVHRGWNLDLSLYAITDQRYNEKHNRNMAEAVQQVLEGGASVLQVREKTASTLEFVKSVETVIGIAKRFQVPVIVNDRIDVLLATDADGVHLGQDDLPVEKVRRMIGFSKILGISVKTRDEAIEAQKAGADYLGVGAVFPTDSKDSSVVGIEGLLQIVQSVRIPVVAIGGISHSNAEEVLQAGVQGLAIISAIFDQQDVTAATASLKSTIDSTGSLKRSID